MRFSTKCWQTVAIVALIALQGRGGILTEHYFPQSAVDNTFSHQLKIKINYFQYHIVFNGGKIWQPMSSDLSSKYKYVIEDLWCAPVDWIEKDQKDPYQL